MIKMALFFMQPSFFLKKAYSITDVLIIHIFAHEKRDISSRKIDKRHL